MEKEFKTFSTAEDKKKTFTAFTEKIKDIFKLNITFDAAVTKAILKRLDTEYKHYYYE